MPHAHHAHDSLDKNGPALPLKIALLFGLTFFAAELTVALLSHSLAVLGDSLHNLSHVFVISFSMVGLALATRKPTKKMTYGLRRLEFLVPATNAIFLAIVGALLISEGRFRLSSPTEISGMPIIIVSSLDILSNGIVALLVRKHLKRLTIKTVAAHLLIDALVSIAVIVGGIAIVFWSWWQADSYAAILIGIFAIFSAGFILFKIGYRLMEGVPGTISFDEVKAFLMQNENVLAVEDLHIWSIGEDYNVLSAHLLIKPLGTEDADRFLRSIRTQLTQRFPIAHVTIQHEAQLCDTKD